MHVVASAQILTFQRKEFPCSHFSLLFLYQIDRFLVARGHVARVSLKNQKGKMEDDSVAVRCHGGPIAKKKMYA